MEVEEVSKVLEMDGCVFGKKFGRYRVRVYERQEDVEVNDDLPAGINREQIPKENDSIQSVHSCGLASGSHPGITYDDIVIFDGMPPAMSKEDVQYLLWGTNISRHDIRLVRLEQYPYILIIFQNDSIARNVVRRWNGTVITTKGGSHTVRVRLATNVLIEKQSDDTTAKSVLKMTQIPPKIAPQDIAEFFDGLPVKAKGIHLQTNLNSTGDSVAYIEFEGLESARRGLAKDNFKLGGKFKQKNCRLSMVTEMEMELELLRYSHARESSMRYKPGSARIYSSFHQMIDPFHSIQRQSLANPRMFMPGPMPATQWMPNMGFRASNSNSHLTARASGLAEKSNSARYYVKDLETGKALYLDQTFSPTVIQSEKNTEVECVKQPGVQATRGPVKLPGDANNASSESEATHINASGSEGMEKGHRMQHKRHSQEMGASQIGLRNERPHKLKHM